MKKNITIVVLLATLSMAYGQTNTFPATGNVGIGTTDPSEKLEINGNVKAAKFITSGGTVLNLVRGDGSLNTTYDANTLGNNIDFNSLNYDAYNLIKTQPLHTPNYTGQTNTPEYNYGQLLTFGSLDGLFPAQLAFMNGGNIFYRVKYSAGINPFNFSGTAWKQIVNTTGGSASYMAKFLGGGSIGNSIIYDNGTNVGIGRLNPQVKLEVKSLQNNTIAPANGVAKFVGNDAGIFVGTLAGTPNYGSWLQSMRETDALPFQMLINPLGGDVGIGTSTPSAKLDVAGTSSFSGNMKVTAKLEAKEIKVTTTPTADFVFATDYDLPKLEEVEKHIKEKKHLPEIASAKQMEKEGVNIGEFQIKLLQKIEELTLYSIEQNKRIKELEFQNKEMLELKKKIQILTNKNKK